MGLPGPTDEASGLPEPTGEASGLPGPTGEANGLSEPMRLPEPMKVVFMGTPEFAVAALKALATDVSGRFTVELVFTRPDAASGRGKAPVPSPVRVCAEERGIPVVTPPSFYATAEAPRTQGDGSIVLSSPPGGARVIAAPPPPVPLFNVRGERVVDAEIIGRIAAVEPDFIVVAAYGIILPRQVLELPRFGCVNIHASLLPRWRGAAPIQRAILAGDERAGVSIMRMEEGLDTGAYCAVASTSVGEKNAAKLTAELAALGAKLLLETLPRIANGTAVWTEQDVDGVTYADKLSKRESALDPAVCAEANVRRTFASTPQAPARCVICGKSVTVLAAAKGDAGAGQPVGQWPVGQPVGQRPVGQGAVPCVAPVERDLDPSPLRSCPVSFRDKRLLLATVDGSFEVLALKPDGKKEMAAHAFAVGIKELQRGSELPATWCAIEQDGRQAR
jgi:methionyl-tRNA formyltransferase